MALRVTEINMESKQFPRSANSIDDKVGQLRGRVLEHIPAQISDDNTQRFVSQYFADVPPEDLLNRDPASLARIALNHLEFGKQRQIGSPLVRVFSPEQIDHKPGVRHLALEIVTDDMPFLVDSVGMEINRQGLIITLTVHPLIKVRRDKNGVLQEVVDKPGPDLIAESFLRIEMENEATNEDVAGIESGVKQVLRDVSFAVQDWTRTQHKVEEVKASSKEAAVALSEQEIAETGAFLDWLVNDHFIFLGYREYNLLEKDGQDLLEIVPASGLGILRDKPGDAMSKSFSVLPQHVRNYAKAKNLLTLTKGNALATVHRSTHIDYVGIKKFDKSGEVTGEHRFLGLYTSKVYLDDPYEIPVVRNKLQEVTRRSGLQVGSHSEKALQTILRNYHRSELFQISTDLLYEISLGILYSQERQQTRLFARTDTFGRYVSCLVFVPRDRYTTELRMRVQEILLHAFNGLNSEFTIQLGASILARINFWIRTDPAHTKKVDLAALEQKLVKATRTWQEELFGALEKKVQSTDRIKMLLKIYGDAFPASYIEYYKTASAAAKDILLMESVDRNKDLNMALYRLPEDNKGIIRIKLFHLAEPIPLSNILPILENFNLRITTERPFPVWRKNKEVVWIDAFKTLHVLGGHFDLPSLDQRFQAALLHVWKGHAENDGFNRLVLDAGLDWRQVSVLRSCSRYLTQLGVPFSQRYMEDALVNNPGISRLLVGFFETKFKPDLEHREASVAAMLEQIDDDINEVSSLDEDRILRLFLSVMHAALRTNYFQQRGQEFRPALAIKLMPAEIDAAPQPRPRFEIFVYSPRVEGVHLRGGKVARGGLRWSDRREDYRTEILGLMKAQMVKNAVIVPVGAKGGFVLKQPPPDGAALKQEVLTCYRMFIQSLLDLADNLIDGEPVTPPDTICYDEKDPYFVVAADKGTATFSDVANEIAISNNFWLGDAFASGGSTGYDHKKMGITARGAWESVKRHFRQQGIDCQSTPFTTVGVGDMGGDVFGNGMLLSPFTQLIAAFNHVHIFIDPNPEHTISFAERKRLFEGPDSSWTDYNQELISKGGGVFQRSAKSIPISPQIKLALDIQADRLTPNELIRHILTAPVDLLWNGGIGTFVKSKSESHADAGDRVNDPIRINGEDLRCKIVGEGGNLGVTQLGRIEFARNGGYIYSDSIDNSGGVDSSDHEVNIKTLLNDVVSSGELTEEERNKLLQEMTDEVGELVLENNYRQTQAINITCYQAPRQLEAHTRFIRFLEKSGKMDRSLEYLPDDEEITNRRNDGLGLTRPEISILLSYAKITLYEDLLQSDVCEDPYLVAQLKNYFPTPLRGRYESYMRRHPLRREIIATHFTNTVIDATGITIMQRFLEQSNFASPEVTLAYIAAREIFDTASYRRRIEALDNQVPAEMQITMTIEAGRLVERATLWLLQNQPRHPNIENMVECYRRGVQTIIENMLSVITPQHRSAIENSIKQFVEAGVENALATRCCTMRAVYSGLDIVEVSSNAKADVLDTARIYFQIGHDLQLFWLREQISSLEGDYWQQLAADGIRSDLFRYQRLITAEAISISNSDHADVLPAWKREHEVEITRANKVVSEVRDAPHLNLAMFTVAMREIEKLVS